MRRPIFAAPAGAAIRLVETKAAQSIEDDGKGNCSWSVTPMRLIADDSPAVVLSAEHGSAKFGGGVVAATAILAIGIAVCGIQEEGVSRRTIFERSLRPAPPSLPASRRRAALPRGNP